MHISVQTLPMLVALTTLVAAVPHPRLDVSTDTKLTNTEAIDFLVRALPSVWEVLLNDSFSTQGQRMRDMTLAFLPTARQFVEARAAGKGRSLTSKERQHLQAAEELVPVLMQTMVDTMDKDPNTLIAASSRDSVNTSSFSAMSNREVMEFIVHALPSIWQVLLKDSGSTPSQMLQDVTLAFIPAARQIAETRAHNEGRSLTSEQKQLMQLAEEWVPGIIQTIMQTMMTQ